ncbi:hypothetical protein ACO229_06525 [Promicromonospora sp. MS192]|uniref:hypothetical protein n=1 Tax=Promicromonospora sp. MS192 TaxID=3412684 RepID=UPI003C2B592C
MNNDDTPSAREAVTAQAGSLALALWHDGTTTDEHGEVRQRYAYRIADSTAPGAVPHDGRDIESGAGAEVDTTAGLRALVAFLSAAGEGYRYQMGNPLSEPESLDLFPEWVTEAAYPNADELTMLSFELGSPHRPEAEPAAVEVAPIAPREPQHVQDGTRWPPGRYYTVVFFQDEQVHAVVDLLQGKGAQAAIDHLAQRDLGAKTLDAALFNQDYHAEAPHYPGTREATGGPYVLTCHPGLGTVQLLREFPTQAPDGWPDRYTGITSSCAGPRPESPNQPPPAPRSTGPLEPPLRPTGQEPDRGPSL